MIVKQSPSWSAGGESYLVITNTVTLDSVALLTAKDDQAPLIAVYIRARDSHRIESIWAGEYNFYYVLGEDWDSANARFTRKTEYHRFTGTVNFERIIDPKTRTVNYTYWRLPLLGGSEEPQLPIIDAATFPSLK